MEASVEMASLLLSIPPNPCVPVDQCMRHYHNLNHIFSTHFGVFEENHWRNIRRFFITIFTLLSFRLATSSDSFSRKNQQPQSSCLAGVVDDGAAAGTSVDRAARLCDEPNRLHVHATEESIGGLEKGGLGGEDEKDEEGKNNEKGKKDEKNGKKDDEDAVPRVGCLLCGGVVLHDDSHAL